MIVEILRDGSVFCVVEVYEIRVVCYFPIQAVPVLVILLWDQNKFFLTTKIGDLSLVLKSDKLFVPSVLFLSKGNPP